MLKKLLPKNILEKMKNSVALMGIEN